MPEGAGDHDERSQVTTTDQSAEVRYPLEPVRYATYSDVERLYGLSRTTTWRAIRNGHVEAVRVGRSVRISRASLDEFMKERTIAR